MLRKQVYLTEDQNEQLAAAARRQRRSEAAVLREALEQYFGRRASTPRAHTKDAIWGVVGIGNDRDDDLSSRVDEVLYGRPSQS